MTDTDSALWQQAQRDYFIALRGVLKAWDEADPTIPPTAEAIQRGTATLLLHHKYLLEQERIHVRVPDRGGWVPAQAAVSSDAPNTSHAPAAGIPSQCPACSGPVWDNRTNKKSPKAPDWKCKNKECVDAKGFVTGGWIKESPVMQRAKAEGAKAGVAAGRNFNEKPAVLDDDDSDSSLPF